MQNYLTVMQTSKMLNMEPEKMKALLDDNELYFAVKIGNEWRIGEEDLENYLKRLKEFKMVQSAKKHLCEIREEVESKGYSINDFEGIVKEIEAEENYSA